MVPMTLAAATEYFASRGVLRAGEGAGWSASTQSVSLAGLDRLTAARVAPCARAVARLLAYDTNQSVLLLIDERGIWPSSEDPLVLTLLRLRGGLGPAAADVDGWPAVLLAPYEPAELASLLACCLCGGMGLVACSSSGDRSVRINHDGKGWLAGNDPAQMAAVAQLLSG